jgi:hypothetical protein
MSGAKDPSRNPKIIILDNHIETRCDTSGGISLLSDGVALISNNIILKGGPKAKGITVLGSDGLVAHNKISGSGLCTMMTASFNVFEGCRNNFVDNDTSAFKASLADVVLKSPCNVLIGTCSKVIDQGQDNKIIR